jgi:lysozyme family protein
MRDNFDPSLKHVLVHEGGYVNHPKDPGGATNKGVTQDVYNTYRARRKLVPASVKVISDHEVKDIYRTQYWDKIKGDDLPAGVDYCVFDFAVNSGVSRAIKYLQGAVGATPDGIIGPATLAAVKRMDPTRLINEICTRRQAFLEGLSTFKTFGKGWTRRIAGVEATAKGMV